MRLTVNGEVRDAPDQATLAEFLASLGIEGGRVAVERNREIAPKSLWPQIALADGDAAGDRAVRWGRVMRGASTVRDAHADLVRVLRCVESVDNYSRLEVAPDFARNAGLNRADFENARKVIDELLADPSVSNADIKGLLNRIDAWQFDSPFGGDAKAARQHLEAAREAIAAWINQQ